MMGLTAVKERVRDFLRVATFNYDSEIAGQPITELKLHRLFIGNPGTGKTSVAKIYGKILKELHFLSNGSVELKGASDVAGKKNMQNVLRAC